MRNLEKEIEALEKRLVLLENRMGIRRSPSVARLDDDTGYDTTLLNEAQIRETMRLMDAVKNCQHCMSDRMIELDRMLRNKPSNEFTLADLRTAIDIDYYVNRPSLLIL